MPSGVNFFPSQSGFVGAEFVRLKAQTARMDYAKALQAALPTMPESDTIKLN